MGPEIDAGHLIDALTRQRNRAQDEASQWEALYRQEVAAREAAEAATEPTSPAPETDPRSLGV